jgi:uncharacterized membrane protein
MREFWTYIKVTLLGGLLFLLPLAVILVILVKVGEVAVKTADPVADMLPYSKVTAITIVYVAGAILIAFVAFVVGMFARSLSSGKLVSWLEDRVLMRFPPYAVVRNVSQNIAGIEDDRGMKPVLVRVDHGWQVGFAVEPANAGYITIFMPDVPNPASGVVRIVASESVTPIDAPVQEVFKCLKRSGRDLRELVQMPPKPRAAQARAK